MVSPRVKPSSGPCSPLVPPQAGKRRRSAAAKEQRPSAAAAAAAPLDNSTASVSSLVDNTKKFDSPVDCLKAIVSLHEKSTMQDWLQHRHFTFATPTEDEMAAYDLEVVRAIREGNLDKLREMLEEEGRNFDACNRFGESLIHMSCRRGDLTVVRFLIEEAQVKVNRCDDFGRTCLHDALWTPSPNLELIKFLLTKVPPSMLLAHDARGHTPFHYSRREHWPTWIAFLRENAGIILQRVSILQGFVSDDHRIA